MLLACVQTDIQIADVSANVKTVVKTIESLGQRNVDLAVFPECMLTGYAFDNRADALEASLQEDSPEIQMIAEAACRSNLAVTIGLLLREENRLFNAALLIDGNRCFEGRSAPTVVGRYHKVHLPYLGVDRFVDRGEIPYQAWPLTCRDGQIARIGMGICYDSSFPEPMRALGLAGADVIALGTNWPVAASRTAEIVPPARSMENHLFFVAANRVGSEHGFEFCGLSSICGPDGVELARAIGNETTVLFADVDLAQARNKRIERTPGKHVIDRFADRRPEFYATIVDPIAAPAITPQEND
ncbi:N-carbamoyl-D-amino acid hydrolase [Neorhodopirellula pilleata]|uniref:N-carbamoyl-D-amino acid hydrolase n=2 Tax=Neorhodopirellula pilleata TaxID=2714738 RepID=A0A5C6A878_9BACT|nr:N-carbamoyl-D-amino acid hydrolase [Neorhodopirellula pilleata]